MAKVIAVIFVLALLGALLGYRLYNKPHRSVEDEVSIKTDAAALFNAFETDEGRANTSYLDKVLEVSGTVSEILSNQDGNSVLVLKTNDPLFGITCTMDGEIGNVQPGTTVIVKGICTGYLSDVVITKGILIE